MLQCNIYPMFFEKTSPFVHRSYAFPPGGQKIGIRISIRQKKAGHNGPAELIREA
jgi:hypothetical protein